MIVDADDLRSLIAFTPDGAELGKLTAHGIWGVRPHDLKIRCAIFALRRRRHIHFLESDDPIEVYYNHLRQKAPRSKRAAGQLRRVIKKAPPVSGTGAAPPSELRIVVSAEPRRQGRLEALKIKSLNL